MKKMVSSINFFSIFLKWESNVSRSILFSPPLRGEMLSSSWEIAPISRSSEIIEMPPSMETVGPNSFLARSTASAAGIIHQCAFEFSSNNSGRA